MQYKHEREELQEYNCFTDTNENDGWRFITTTDACNELLERLSPSRSMFRHGRLISVTPNQITVESWLGLCHDTHSFRGTSEDMASLYQFCSILLQVTTQFPEYTGKTKHPAVAKNDDKRISLPVEFVKFFEVPCPADEVHIALALLISPIDYKFTRQLLKCQTHDLKYLLSLKNENPWLTPEDMRTLL